jgi:hypothetical protein
MIDVVVVDDHPVVRAGMRTVLDGAAGVTVVAGVFLVIRVYEQASYAPTLPDSDLMHRVWQEGRRLRWQLWRLGVFSTA